MYGISQGSNLDPCDFSIYTLPVGHMIRKHYSNAKFMFVAYDQQIYVIFHPCDPLHANSSVEPLIAHFRAWFIKNVFSCLLIPKQIS